MPSRVATLENRLDVLETRSSSIENQLKDGFQMILARLDRGDRGDQTERDRSKSRPAAQGTGQTPPPKALKFEAHANASASTLGS